MVDHEFGGAWTEIKLDILRKYLHFYTQALKNKPFKLLYIDAFAGSGSRSEKIPHSLLLGEEEKKLIYAGSAKIALDIERKFDHYLFIETDKERYDALQTLKNDYPSLDIRVYNADANERIQTICSRPVWGTSSKYRGVIFLNPYGNNVEWKTLEAIASTRSLDVWFLFPLSGLYRQAAHDFEKIEDYKKKNITKMLGTDEWETAFYNKTQFIGLFGTTEQTERIGITEIEQWVKNRLKKCFPCVSEPLALPVEKKPQKFSLFFCVSNPSGGAINLALKVANHILKPEKQ